MIHVKDILALGATAPVRLTSIRGTYYRKVTPVSGASPLQEIEAALAAKLYYVALGATLTLPDVCAALEAPELELSAARPFCAEPLELEELAELAIRDALDVPRSGLALKHGITLPNSPGTIDSDYRGEVQVILLNAGGEAFEVTPAMRIAQAVLAPVVRAEVVEVDDLSTTERGGRAASSSSCSRRRCCTIRMISSIRASTISVTRVRGTSPSGTPSSSSTVGTSIRVLSSQERCWTLP